MTRTKIIDRRFPGVGRIAIASGTTNPVTFKKINEDLTRIYQDGRLDILRAIRDGDVRPLELRDAARRNQLDTLATGKTARTLDTAMADWIDALTEDEASDAHRANLHTYRRRFASVMPKGRIADLPAILESLRDTMGKTHPRSFNYARSSALAFLRDTVKRNHALYREAQAVEPVKRKTKRIGRPLPVEEMRERFPSPTVGIVDSIAWTMATTGMHQSELWGRWTVTAEGHIHVFGTKREGRDRDIPYVIPPVPPVIHRRTFEDKMRLRFGSDVQPYDLRRTYAHWMELAGIPRTRRRLYMGHGAVDVTDLYESHEVTAFLIDDGKKLRALLGFGE